MGHQFILGKFANPPSPQLIGNPSIDFQEAQEKKIEKEMNCSVLQFISGKFFNISMHPNPYLPCLNRKDELVCKPSPIPSFFISPLVY